ncbi:5-bromo-4-chloroindolyl phosphate hydrolysis family protein [Bacillus benzoevorans]|uniref:5-bromo-4-chloroindolyl phosphate hydrolysis protein n=1 Tax=Bacillus benzoevorans TaxID=1456 RepID=A0A7X0LW70_9BACI|nr:5-bromo-4-chloroindolyl phosphate hydrolysis family protein [Bacillus benzoevorans]MBB6446383.1 5-bromo-4-chloroindolyl phosphate hydrolysis protein [Bacillus benzoevorans]
MKSFFQFVLRSAAGGFVSVLVWAISFLAFHEDIVISLLYGLVSGMAVFFTLKWVNRRQFLRSNGLTRREYQYIKRNLKEAKLKINRLQKAFIRGRSLSNMKQNIDIIRVVNRIYFITKKEPKRFFQAERFYYSHLDSIVELSEKYAFLNSQPSKTPELADSLKETKVTINQLTDTLEKDLYIVLEDDIDHLQFELDVAKQELQKRPLEIEDRRK